MNASKIIKQLKKKYPGKNIIVNTPEFPLEIVVELDSKKQKLALAVIDFARPHYHKVNTEIYEVIKGELIVYLKGETVLLKAGSKIKIKPYGIHSAVGKETWIYVHFDPGWKFEDHILVKSVEGK